MASRSVPGGSVGIIYPMKDEEDRHQDMRVWKACQGSPLYVMARFQFALDTPSA